MAPAFSKPSGWADLCPDLVGRIAGRLLTVTDFVRFRAVCRSWRASVRPSDLQPHLPWLMLQYNPDSDTRQFHCLATGAVYHLSLPEAQGKRVIGANHGWLILVQENTSIINLLNPLTRSCFTLPPSTFTGDKVGHAIITSSPNTPSGTCTVVILLKQNCHLVAYCSGDGGRWGPWAVVNTGLPSDVYGAYDVAFHRRKFYIVNSHAEVAIVDVSPPAATATRLQSAELPFPLDDDIMMEKAFLAVSDDQLLLFVFFSMVESDDESEEPNRPLISFDIFRLEETGQPSWVGVRSMPDQTVFKCNAQVVVVRTGMFPGIRKNCLYFAFCNNGELAVQTIRVFDMENWHSECRSLRPDSLPVFGIDPVWLVPSLI
ncbi:F-box protein At1g10110-like [Phoenix dactylifera]|uniref:F-box protein At1g10110-like n=1 Tax=Phoenix dactylifera TaxID=42345 RepID=A0A8B7CVT3_PHODC|nr:F-box protein At1g10110-like [Phoenix dactylifera]